MYHSRDSKFFTLARLLFNTDAHDSGGESMTTHSHCLYSTAPMTKILKAIRNLVLTVVIHDYAGHEGRSLAVENA